MTTAVRHFQITNPNNAIILPTSTPDLRAPLQVDKGGEDYCFLSIERTIQAAEIAAANGSLIDNANPTVGFLFAQLTGALIKHVVSISLKKNINAPNTPTAANLFTQWGTSLGTAANYTNLGTRIANVNDTTQLGYSTDYSNLYLYDFSGGDATRKVAAGDRIIVLLELGNS